MEVNTPTPQKIGYARVSSLGQNLDSQIDELKKAGCNEENIFSDSISGIKQDRPGWNNLMKYIRSQDTLVITELSRMSRSLIHLLNLVSEFEDRKIKIVSLRENIDTTTATGRFFVNMMGSISQMERELKKERVHSGIESAKARGKSGGRPKADQEVLEQAKIIYENSDKSASEICRSFGVGRRTFFYYLKNKNTRKNSSFRGDNKNHF